jgi:hypothetical protein
VTMKTDIPTREEGDDSPFDQMLTQQGPGPDQPEYGVQPWSQPEAPELSERGAVNEATFHPELEYIRQFKAQNKLLQQIYDVLAGRERPALAIQELQAGTRTVVATRFTIQYLIVTNSAGAAGNVLLTLGTRVYTFPIPAGSTISIPLPLVIEKGTDVLATNGQIFLVGHLTAAEGG